MGASPSGRIADQSSTLMPEGINSNDSYSCYKQLQNYSSHIKQTTSMHQPITKHQTQTQTTTTRIFAEVLEVIMIQCSDINT